MKLVHDVSADFKPFEVVCSCCSNTWLVEKDDLKFQPAAQRDHDQSGSVYVFCPKGKGMITISQKTDGYDKILLIAKDNSVRTER